MRTPRHIVAFRTIGVVAALYVSGNLLVACDRQMERAWEQRNLDPKVGPVYLERNKSQWKVCDGTTLLYKGKSLRGLAISAIDQSEECR